MQINDRERQLIAQDIDAYLQQHQQKDLLRLLTCGSVDDGKSTLIGRLLFDSKLIYEDQLAALETASAANGTVETGPDLALLTDGLRAEREQGITIDVAYRFFSTARRKFIIADTPGHEQYTRNMATGASTADLAVVLIDVRHGLLAQTKRHSFIASLLGIKHMIVAVNKMDLLEYSQSAFDAITEAYKAFSVRLSIPDIRFIPISALSGDNVVFESDKMPWYKGPPLLHMLESVHIASDRNMVDFRLPVQFVLRPDPSFRGYQGTIASGKLSVGEEIVVQPSGRTSTVKEIFIGAEPSERAFAPQSVTITLNDEVDVSRGDLIVKSKNQAKYTTLFEAMVVWMSDSPLIPEHSYLIKLGTQTVPAKVADLRYVVDVNTLERKTSSPELPLNGVGRVLIESQRPVLFDAYSRNRSTGGFILIDRFSNVTVGAGMILDRESAELKRAKREGRQTDQIKSVLKSQITTAERSQRLKHAPLTLWLTGLPRSGKTTIAVALERRLWDLGYTVSTIDGTELRAGMNYDLGFSLEDRREASRRGAHMCRLFNDQGSIVIAAFVSPTRDIRNVAREIVGSKRFVEIYVHADAETCAQRDADLKGDTYRNARAGTLRSFTGVSANFERPENDAIHLDTEQFDAPTCVTKLIDSLLNSDRLAPISKD